jgi:hypothetical protein
MNKQLLTLALITGLAGSAFAGLATDKTDKNKKNSVIIIDLPVWSEEDLTDISAEMYVHTTNDALEIAPQTYQVYDRQDRLVLEETIGFENDPSRDMKALMRKSEFLMEKGDLLIYKVF